VIDRFHVAEQYRDAADSLRKQELKRLKLELPHAEYQQLKGSLWAFRKNSTDLTPEEQARLHACLPMRRNCTPLTFCAKSCGILHGRSRSRLLKFAPFLYSVSITFPYLCATIKAKDDSVRRVADMSLRILVVDDDKQVVRILQSYLTQEGMTVLVAYDGEEALHLIRRERPDCVVLDLMLPKRSGLDLTRLVRGLRLDREQHLFDAGRSRPRPDADRVCAAARLYGVSESCFYARGVG
jgi:hypothetical protein